VVNCGITGALVWVAHPKIINVKKIIKIAIFIFSFASLQNRFFENLLLFLDSKKHPPLSQDKAD